jgi:hypothetical protein
VAGVAPGLRIDGYDIQSAQPLESPILRTDLHGVPVMKRMQAMFFALLLADLDGNFMFDFEGTVEGNRLEVSGY